jgi:hypothetical protein
MAHPAVGRAEVQCTLAELKAPEALRAELDCCLCCALLHQPVALPCGHALCRGCVCRTLDQASPARAPQCPLCRADLAWLLAWVGARARARGEPLAHGGAQLAPSATLEWVLCAHFGQ